MLTSSLLMDVFTRITPPQTEILLSALYGGIFSGVGLGLVFLGGASTGGSDIGARLLRRRFGSLPLGRILLTIDLTIVALTGAVYHDVSKALYSAVSLYVSSVVMDGSSMGWTIPRSRSSSLNALKKSSLPLRKSSTAASRFWRAAAVIPARRSRFCSAPSGGGRPRS